VMDSRAGRRRRWCGAPVRTIFASPTRTATIRARRWGRSRSARSLAGDLGLFVDPHTLVERGGESGTHDAGVGAQRAQLELAWNLEVVGQVGMVARDAAAQHDEIRPEQRMRAVQD